MNEIQLPTKTAELKFRRLLRQITGAHNNCPISIVAGEENKFPEFVGKPPSAFIKSMRWQTLNGIRIADYKIQYVPSTQKIEIGIKILNAIKSLSVIKEKGKHITTINNRKIELPNSTLLKFLNRVLSNNE